MPSAIALASSGTLVLGTICGSPAAQADMTGGAMQQWLLDDETACLRAGPRIKVAILPARVLEIRTLVPGRTPHRAGWWC